MQALSVRWRLPLVLSFAPLFAACGGEAETDELRGSFRLLRGAGPVSCASEPAVRRVELSLYDESGVSRRPGYPKTLSCADGAFAIPGVALGRHLVRIAALGEVGTADEEVMFTAERVVDFPADNELAFELRPEVAFFELAWTFAPHGDLGPCEGEVASVQVFVSSGTSEGAAFSGSFGCAETPKALNGAFAPRMYTVRLDARSREGFTVYSVTQNRLLSRGENRFDAALEPLGGQLRLDWQFRVAGGAPIQSCDDGEVGVGQVSVRVAGATGGDAVEETVACDAVRPHALTAARFTRGRELVVTLRAEGTHRFLGQRAFTMPEGDHELPLLTLRAVGNVALGFSVTSSSACSPERVDRYVAELREPGGDRAYEGTAAPEARAIAFSDVVYGMYDVRLMGFSGEDELCRVQAARTVGARENDWTDFSL